MKAEGITAIVSGLKEAGVDFVASLPCTGFGQVIPVVESDRHFTHVPVCNEGDAIGICAGAWLGGKTPVLVAENAGFLLSTYALAMMYRFGDCPLLLLLDHRGDFGEGDGYFYFGAGRVTVPVLAAFQIPFTIVRQIEMFKAELLRGQKTSEASAKPVAVLFSGEEVW